MVAVWTTDQAALFYVQSGWGKMVLTSVVVYIGTLSSAYMAAQPSLGRGCCIPKRDTPCRICGPRKVEHGKPRTNWLERIVLHISYDPSTLKTAGSQNRSSSASDSHCDLLAVVTAATGDRPVKSGPENFTRLYNYFRNLMRWNEAHHSLIKRCDRIQASGRNQCAVSKQCARGFGNRAVGRAPS